MSLGPLILAAAAGQHDLEHRLVTVLIELCLIIAVARVFAVGFRRIGQPAVVGEIIAGLVLGPSVFGRLPGLRGLWLVVFPQNDPALKHQAELLMTGHLPADQIAHVVEMVRLGNVFEMLSQLGLIFLLFLIGLEFDFGHLRTHNRSALGISVTGVVFPFALGAGLAAWMHRALGLHEPLLGFALFMGTAMSITAIPILGRIMMEMGITRSRLGAVTITAAAVDDATGWILLATVSAIVRAAFRPAATVLMLAECLAFAALMVWVVRPLLKRWIRRAVAHGTLGLNSLAVLLIVTFLCSIATARIGIFAIFGAFLLGAILSDEARFREAVTAQLHRFVTVFFLPIFFTYTGLRTRIDTLDTPALWAFAALVSAAAILGKFGGCTLAARAGGFGPRESACIGVMMNTRALMELIVINAGHDLGVIPDSVFCMLVMMAVLTTVMTSPILLRLMRGTELESLIARSGFQKPSPRTGRHGLQPVAR